MNAFEADGTLQCEAAQSSNVEAELKRLPEANRRLRIERDILKNQRYFSRRKAAESEVYSGSS